MSIASILFPQMGINNHKWELNNAMIPNMGEKIIKILADNVARNCAPGYRFEKIVDLGSRSGVGKSTIARIKNGNTAARIDNVEAIAAAYGLQAWQFLVPELDVKNPPELFGKGLTAAETELLTAFAHMTEPEREGLMANATAVVRIRSRQNDSKSA